MTATSTLEERDLLLSVLQDNANSDATVPNVLVRAAADLLGVSTRQVRRYLKAGAVERRKHFVPNDAHMDVLYSCSGNIEEAYRTCLNQGLVQNRQQDPRRGFCERTFRRGFDLYADQALVAGARFGWSGLIVRRAYGTKHAPAKGHTYATDSSPLDLVCRDNPGGGPGGKVIDLWATPVIDEWSRLVPVISTTNGQPDTTTTIALLAAAICGHEADDGTMIGGMPQHVLSDNGSEYKSLPVTKGLVRIGMKRVIDEADLDRLLPACPDSSHSDSHDGSQGGSPGGDPEVAGPGTPSPEGGTGKARDDSTTSTNAETGTGMNTASQDSRAQAASTGVGYLDDPEDWADDEFVESTPINHKFTHPHSPWENGIAEAFHRTVHVRFSAMLPGYVNPRWPEFRRLAERKRWQDHPELLLTRDQVEALLQRWVTKYNFEYRHSALGGMTPFEKWKTGPDLPLPDPRAVRLAMLSDQTRVVDGGKVQIFKKNYHLTALGKHDGHRVEVRYLPGRTESVEVFYLGEHLGTAIREDLLTPGWHSVNKGQRDKQTNTFLAHAEAGDYLRMKRAREELLALDYPEDDLPVLPQPVDTGRDRPDPPAKAPVSSDEARQLLLDLKAERLAKATARTVGEQPTVAAGAHADQSAKADRPDVAETPPGGAPRSATAQPAAGRAAKKAPHGTPARPGQTTPPNAPIDDGNEMIA